MKQKGVKQTYACGCVVIARKGKLSIFPACDKLTCSVKSMVKLNAATYKTRQRDTEETLRLPHSTSKSAVQIQRSRFR